MAAGKDPTQPIDAADDVRAILEDERWAVADARANFKAVSDRMGGKLSLSAKTVAHMPLALEGAEHQSARKAAFAETLPASEQALAAAYTIRASDAAKHLQGEPGDLIHHLVNPLVDHTLIAANRPLAKMPKAVQEAFRDAVQKNDGFDRFFDPFTPVGRRLANEAVLTAITAPLLKAGISEEDGVAICRGFVMGRDPLRSVFATIILEHAGGVAPNAATKSARTPDPTVPIGVYWVMRRTPDAKTNVRLNLGGDPNLIFGAGRHRCVGQALARTAVSALRLTLGDPKMRVIVSSFDPCGKDAVFAMPRALSGWVETDAG